ELARPCARTRTLSYGSTLTPAVFYPPGKLLAQSSGRTRYEYGPEFLSGRPFGWCGRARLTIDVPSTGLIHRICRAIFCPEDVTCRAKRENAGAGFASRPPRNKIPTSY